MPQVSDFYERKRRLAYGFAALSIALLLSVTVLGLSLESYSHPGISFDGEAAYVVHRASSDDGEPRSRVLVLDPRLHVRAHYRLMGDARAVLATGEDLTAYFGSRYAVLREGQTVRGADLGQKWDVLAAVQEPAQGQAWIFGWAAGKIVARKRIRGNYSEAIDVAPAALTDRITAGLWSGAGPVVAWRERDSTKIKVARLDGASFVPVAEFDVGAAQHWDVAFPDGRALLLYYHREDRTFSRLTLRLACCEGCGRPRPPEKLSFLDPVFVVGRLVTGLAATIAEDRLVVVVSRPSTIQHAAAPLATLQAAPDARLAPLATEALWRRIMGFLFPIIMLFFSFSLIFLGFTLLRERTQFVLERLQPVARQGPPPAAILQRAMADILDQMLLIPFFVVLSSVLNVTPETPSLDYLDPRTLAFMGVWYGLHFVYCAILEGAWGRTLGKKIIGIRVAELDGARLTWRGAVLRNLLRPLDAEYPLAVFLGASLMMVTRRRQRLGDLVARTMVVDESRIQNPESRTKKGSPDLP